MYVAPSDKQINFISKLARERVVPEADAAAAAAPDLLSKYDASALITRLLAAPKRTVVARGYQKPLEVGMYHTDTGEILRVYKGQQSGQNLVKRVVLNGESYEYQYVGSARTVAGGRSVLGAVKWERMTLEEAQNWGRMTSHCIVCGRRLDDPESVDRGIGPVCKDNV